MEIENATAAVDFLPDNKPVVEEGIDVEFSNLVDLVRWHQRNTFSEVSEDEIIGSVPAEGISKLEEAQIPALYQQLLEEKNHDEIKKKCALILRWERLRETDVGQMISPD